MNNPKGSVWRKWDLHIHTPASHLHNQFGNNWDKYVQKLFESAIDKDIQVIGVTDYFTIDGYKKIRRDYLENANKLKELFDDSEIREIEKILVVPNIEFRLNKFVGNRSINFHVIFSNDMSIQDIEENFLHELNFVYEGNPQRTEEKHKLKINNLEELGKKLKEEHREFRSTSDIRIGMMNAVVDDSEISEVLDSRQSKFKGKYLMGVVADEDLSDIDWDSHDHQTRKVLIQKSDFLLSSNPNTRRWGLGKPPYSEGTERFIQEFKSFKPCIHGSDAHSYKEIGHPCIHRGTKRHKCTQDSGDCELRYCWIKADPTFEGLRQIIYEPELRIRLQEENPCESETYSKIDRCVITFPDDLMISDEIGEKTDFCLTGNYKIEFSNNLTCIIGGRGLGKSAIVHAVFNSWINQDRNRLVKISSPLLSLDFSPTPLKRMKELTACDVPGNTEFFFQNEIEDSARNIDSMSTLIRQRLDKLSLLDLGENLYDLHEDWDSSLNRMNELVQAYDHISEIEKEIKSLEEEVHSLKKQTEIIQSHEYKSFQEAIEKVSKKILGYKTYWSDYERLFIETDSLLELIEQLEWSEEQGSKELKEFHALIFEHKNKISEKFDKFIVEYDKQDFPDQLEGYKKQLREYLRSKGLAEENIVELADANQKINDLIFRIKTLQTEKEPYVEVYSKKVQIESKYKKKHETYKSRISEVASVLERELGGLSISDQEIRFICQIDEGTVRTKVIDFIKDGFPTEITLRSDVIENVLFKDGDISEYVENKDKIKEHVNSYEGAYAHKEILQELMNEEVYLEKIYLRVLKYYYHIDDIKIQTKLGGRLLKNTSFGERCGIVVAITLVAGTNPIVFDQPEDNLDGRFISEVLVPLIRKQKHNRQIILITRDANIVIGGDAELIHILEGTERRTEVIPSSIENTNSRSKYIWILDGGEEAFNKREQKYDI